MFSTLLRHTASDSVHCYLYALVPLFRLLHLISNVTRPLYQTILVFADCLYVYIPLTPLMTHESCLPCLFLL
jgi:hypothetical protein